MQSAQSVMRETTELDYFKRRIIKLSILSRKLRGKTRKFSKYLNISKISRKLLNISNNAHEKVLYSDWLRAVQFKCNTSAKSVTPAQKL